MARDWRRAGLAALAAAMLGGACALGAGAEAADGEQDPAAAQRRVEAALEQIQAGRTGGAIRTLSSTLEGGNLPPALIAKALYARGIAHRREGRPAQAVSDLSGALWLRGGLGGDERAAALKERAAAYADAGLKDPAAGSAPPPRPETASGDGNWLSGLFGASGTSTPPPSASRPRQPEPPPAQKTAAAAPADGWTSNTQVQPSARTSPTRRSRPEGRASSAGSATGRYLVQIGALRAEADAQALAAKARREHATLAALSHSIDRVSGSRGTLYRVRFGPFASAEESRTACARLKDRGLDCLPVRR